MGKLEIEKIISEMTLEEKASLLSGQDAWHTKAIERLRIPATMVSDGPHGLRKQDQKGDHLGMNDSIRAVCFPTASATAASFDRALLKTIGEALGDSCQHEDISVILGPAVNIKRSPLCGRNFEYFSEDPYLAGELSSALIEGIQSRNVGTSIKHFAGNNQEHRRMSSDSVMDERTLREIYLPAFEKAVRQAKPWTVMCSYNRLNGTYASENKWLLTSLLRDEWGFDGYVMSDWGAVSDRVKGVAAGLDLEMPDSSGLNDARIVNAVKEGRLDEKDVDRCVRNILGIVDRYLSGRKPDTPWDMEAQHELARRMAAESMVLLKNEDAVLPLAPDTSVAVIGSFAVRPRFQGGGSSHINCFRTESLMDALKDNPNVRFAMGYEAENEEPDENLIQEAVRLAGQSEKAVIVAGLPDSFESEGYDRSHMRMPLCQNELITRVAEANPNTIVVLYNGSPVEMPWISQVKGVVEAYLGGQAVGGATRMILWGEVNPCGRLPESFPVQLEDNPSYLSYGGEGNTAVYSEGVFVGYRYYDRKKMKVLFPFGYGLSYTTFAYSNIKVRRIRSGPVPEDGNGTAADTFRDTDLLEVSVDVTNTGSRFGKEVIQLYVSPPESRVFRPVRELRGFEKTALEPGQTKTVTFLLDKRAFAYWNKDIHDWFVQTGTYGIEISRSSRETVLRKEIVVTGTVPDARVPLTADTIYMDLADWPEAMEVFGPKILAATTDLQDDSTGQSEAAKEAISDAMSNAMAKYLPLRGLVSFGHSLSYDEICEKLEKMKK